MKRYAVIVAGGKGLRMNANIPKQFITIDGVPILMKTIEQFSGIDNIEIVVVLPESELINWTSLCQEYNFEIKHDVVVGGAARFDSVKKGLKFIGESKGVVAIHDGVRPYVSTELIEKLLNEAEAQNNSIPYTLPKETIRQVQGDSNKHVDRAEYRMIQTPQCFTLDLIQKAYAQGYKETFTDDASVFETMGHKIHLVEGEYGNIKITTQEDIKS